MHTHIYIYIYIYIYNVLVTVSPTQMMRPAQGHICFLFDFTMFVCSHYVSETDCFDMGRISEDYRLKNQTPCKILYQIHLRNRPIKA